MTTEHDTGAWFAGNDIHLSLLDVEYRAQFAAHLAGAFTRMHDNWSTWTTYGGGSNRWHADARHFDEGSLLEYGLMQWDEDPGFEDQSRYHDVRF